MAMKTIGTIQSAVWEPNGGTDSRAANDTFDENANRKVVIKILKNGLMMSPSLYGFAYSAFSFFAMQVRGSSLYPSAS